MHYELFTKSRFLWGLLSLMALCPRLMTAQCAAPTFSSLSAIGTNSATLCWRSAQSNVADHAWNVRVDNQTAGGVTVVDVVVSNGSPGLTITPGPTGPAPIVICYQLSLPDDNTQYAPYVAELCDGAVSSQSAATFMGSFTTSAAAFTPPMPTAYRSINQMVTHTATFNDIALDPSPLTGMGSRLSFTRSLLDDLGNPALGNDLLFNIIENILGIDIPDWVTSAGSSLNLGIASFSLTPTLLIGVDADYGGYIGISSVGTADVNVTYPVNVNLSVPQDAMFGCSDKILVQTSASIGGGAQLEITPSFYETEMGVLFEDAAFSIKIGLTASVRAGCDPTGITGECAYTANWNLLDVLGIPNGELLNIPLDFPTIPPLIKICEEAFSSSANAGTLIGCSAGETTLLELIVDLVQTQPQANLILDAMFSFSETEVTIDQPDLPSVADVPIPEFGGVFKKVTSDNLNQSISGNKILVSGGLDELSNLYLDLLSLGEFFEIPTSFSLGFGVGEVDLGDINLNLSTDLELDYMFDPTLRVNIDLGEPMSWRVINPTGNVTVATGTSQIVPNVLLGHHIEIVLPDDFAATATINEEFLLSAAMSVHSELTYNNSISIELFQLSSGDFEFSVVPEVTIVETELPGSPKTIEDHVLSWSSELFNKPTQSFNLTPDQADPVVTCKPTTVVLNAFGSGAILPTDVFNSGYDLPAGGTGAVHPMMVSPSTFSCEDVGMVTVTLTAEDGNCNMSTCTATVTVLDQAAPEIACQPDFTIQNTFRKCGVDLLATFPQVFDNCSYTLQARYRPVDAGNNPLGAWSAWLANPSRYYAVGRWQIEWWAEDPSGNDANCIVTFNVIDTEAPDIKCFNKTYVFNGEPHLDLVLSDFTSSTDNCAMASLTIDRSRIFCDQLGDIYTITATAVDIYNNVSSCTGTLTIDGLPCGFTDTYGVGCTDVADFIIPSRTFVLQTNGCNNTNPHSDQMGFIKYDLCGNGSISFRVASISSPAAYAGIAMRAGLSPGAVKAEVVTNRVNTARGAVRTTPNGAAWQYPFFLNGRHWFRLERINNQIRILNSADGVQWTVLMAHNMTLPGCLQVGMIAYGSGAVTATFDNVVVNGTVVSALRSMVNEEDPSLTQPLAKQGEVTSDFPLPTSAFPLPTSDFRQAPRGGETRLTLAVYPNPTSGQLTVELPDELPLEGAELEVLDSYGRSLLRETSLDYRQQLDLHRLPSGAYFLRLQTADGRRMIERVIVQSRP